MFCRWRESQKEWGRGEGRWREKNNGQMENNAWIVLVSYVWWLTVCVIYRKWMLNLKLILSRITIMTELRSYYSRYGLLFPAQESALPRNSRPFNISSVRFQFYSFRIPVPACLPCLEGRMPFSFPRASSPVWASVARPLPLMNTLKYSVFWNALPVIFSLLVLLLSFSLIHFSTLWGWRNSQVIPVSLLCHLVSQAAEGSVVYLSEPPGSVAWCPPPPPYPWPSPARPELPPTASSHISVPWLLWFSSAFSFLLGCFYGSSSWSTHLKFHYFYLHMEMRSFIRSYSSVLI